jgi:hypothetical protein
VNSVVETIEDVQKKRLQIIVKLLANKCKSLSANCLAKDAIATNRSRIVLKPSHGPYTVLLPITSSLLQPKDNKPRFCIRCWEILEYVPGQLFRRAGAMQLLITIVFIWFDLTTKEVVQSLIDRVGSISKLTLMETMSIELYWLRLSCYPSFCLMQLTTNLILPCLFHQRKKGYWVPLKLRSRIYPYLIG